MDELQSIFRSIPALVTQSRSLWAARLVTPAKLFYNIPHDAWRVLRQAGAPLVHAGSNLQGHSALPADDAEQPRGAVGLRREAARVAARVPLRICARPSWTRRRVRLTRSDQGSPISADAIERKSYHGGRSRNSMRHKMDQK